MSSVFATGADERYGYHLVNLLGSLQAKSDVFDRVVAYDLGLDSQQRALLERIPRVEVRTVPPFVEHWRQAFTWKPWIWTHLDAGETVFWLDAGATLVRSLSPAIAAIAERGYFVVSQGGELRDIAPPDYLERFHLPPGAESREYVAAGIIGFRVGGAFYERVVVPTYDDCLRGLNLGFSIDEVATKNVGLGRSENPTVRTCRQFRWDQTLLNLHLAQEFPDRVVAAIDEYAGVSSPIEHARQVIWAHRRQGDLRYLKRIRYSGPGTLRARLFGLSIELRWRYKLRNKLLRSATYRLKARKMLTDRRPGISS